jgi:hypothetical protein
VRLRRLWSARDPCTEPARRTSVSFDDASRGTGVSIAPSAFPWVVNEPQGPYTNDMFHIAVVLAVIGIRAVGHMIGDKHTIYRE